MSRDMAHNNNIEEKSARVQAVETNLSTGCECVQYVIMYII